MLLPPKPRLRRLSSSTTGVIWCRLLTIHGSIVSVRPAGVCPAIGMVLQCVDDAANGSDAGCAAGLNAPWGNCTATGLHHCDGHAFAEAPLIHSSRSYEATGPLISYDNTNHFNDRSGC